jgi:hypothetical protein
MKWGLSGAPVPANLPYAAAVNKAAFDTQASPCALYAIFWRETISSERSGWLVQAYGPGTTAANVISGDGGHGLGQLTDSFPPEWADPYTNACYAANKFYDPYLLKWLNRGYTGTTLLKLASDDYNAGDSAVEAAHESGSADAATTGGNYGTDVVTIYLNLLAGRDPDTGRPQ